MKRPLIRRSKASHVPVRTMTTCGFENPTSYAQRVGHCWQLAPTFDHEPSTQIWPPRNSPQPRMPSFDTLTFSFVLSYATPKPSVSATESPTRSTRVGGGGVVTAGVVGAAPGAPVAGAVVGLELGAAS